MALLGAGRVTARILICEDSRTFAAGLKMLLEQDEDLSVVGIAASGEEALSMIPHLSPDLVTMDIELPGLDGIEATKRILATHQVPIVVISSNAPRGSERAAAGLAAGAVDVVAKSYVRLDASANASAVRCGGESSVWCASTLAGAPHRGEASPHATGRSGERGSVVARA